MRTHFRNTRVLWMLAAAAATATPALAVDRTWNGLNVTGGTGSSDVNSSTNWNTGAVPTIGDKAIFGFANTTTGVVDIPASANLFQPDSITLSAAGNNLSGTTSVLSINKDLTLTTLALAASGTDQNNFINRLKVSTTANTTLTLTSSTPLDLYGISSWRMINAGSNGFYTTFNLSNENILFKTLITSLSADKNVGKAVGIQGGTPLQSSVSGNPQMNFTAATGTITLQTASSRPEGTLGLGYTQLGVYSTQQWAATPDANNQNTSFIRMAWRQGNAVAGPEMIRALDGQRLDNLGAVNIVLDTNNTALSGGSDANTAMRIAPGTYGSLNWISDRDNNSRNTFVRLNGDVTFSGKAVQPGFFDSATAAGRLPATVLNYGLVLSSESSGTADFITQKRLYLDGRVLTVTHGVLLDDRIRSASTRRGWAQIDASGGTLNAGNLVISSLNQGGASTTTPALFATQNMGVFGNSGTVLNLAGNFSTNVVSPTGTGVAQGLSASTVNLVGGNAAFKTWEVAAWSGQTVFNTGYAIGTLNVGTASTPGKVQLVNSFLNDDALATLAHDGDKTGEKLMVTSLTIAAGSTLDVNGQVVNIATSLAIDPSGTLDLNSGLLLSEGGLVTTFAGIGNQVAAWNAFASRVIDSDNPDFDFTATTSGGNTVWQATGVPEPSTLAGLALGGFAILQRRRRR